MDKNLKWLSEEIHMQELCYIVDKKRFLDIKQERIDWKIEGWYRKIGGVWKFMDIVDLDEIIGMLKDTIKTLENPKLK